ncbi:MAG: HigA family addiction module antitoxin [Butyrivibrio sp.]|nr:HigA family addiction module antitoxin [Butyrivibrio sp.]
MRKNNLIHPGEILREEFMIPMKISQNRLALAIGVPATRVGEIVNERRAITADTAIRLGTYFKTGPEFWLNLQTNYDLGVAYSEKEQEYELIRM